MTSTLPHRFRESQFRRYEDDIDSIVQAMPLTFRVPTHGLSTVTVAARLRDAITSFKTNRWESNLLDRMEQVNQIIVCERDGGVVAGTREALAIAKVVAEKPTHQERMVYDCQTEHEVIAVIVFVHRKWIDSAILSVGPLSNPQQIAALYDVCLTPIEQNKYLVT